MEPKKNIAILIPNRLQADLIESLLKDQYNICFRGSQTTDLFNFLEEHSTSENSPDLIIASDLTATSITEVINQALLVALPFRIVYCISQVNDYTTPKYINRYAPTGVVTSQDDTQCLVSVIGKVMMDFHSLGDSIADHPSIKLEESQIRYKQAFTNREIDVLQLISVGLMQQEIAERLSISVRTVEKFKKNLRQKTGCANDVTLNLYALQNGMTDGTGAECHFFHQAFFNGFFKSSKKIFGSHSYDGPNPFTVLQSGMGPKLNEQLAEISKHSTYNAETKELIASYFNQLDNHLTEYSEKSQGDGVKTLIIAEDDQDFLDICIDAIESHFKGKIKVIKRCTSGQHLTDTLAEITPDILICDVRMTGPCVFDIATNLKKDGAKTKLIFMTGYAIDDVIERSGQSKPDAFIFKNGSTSMMDKIIKACEGKPVYEPEFIEKFKELFPNEQLKSVL